MTNSPAGADLPMHESQPSVDRYRLRLWPAVLMVIALWTIRVWSSVGEQAPFRFFFGLIIAPAAVTLGLLLWWLFASRLRWSDRLIGIAAFVGIAIATILIAGKNFPAMGLILYALPIIATAWVVWLMISITLPWSVRRAGVLVIFLAIGCMFSILRVDGMDGSFNATFNWRWTPTPEDKLLNALKTGNKPGITDEASQVSQLTLQDGDWPCFRGSHRDSRLTNVHIQTDWQNSPPKELWRHRIGPGWSSFAVVGDRIFTQEQRGTEEFVICYDAQTGGEVWAHADPARFEEVVAGAGPRATPTFHEGRIYAFGATGILNCLDAVSGKLIWSDNVAQETKAETPQWGFSSSPLIGHGLVSVFAGGPNGKTVVAYHLETGELAWPKSADVSTSDSPDPKEKPEPKEKEDAPKSYCSTQLVTIDGVDQILISTSAGLTAYDPETGAIMWDNPWKVDQARVVQPAVYRSNQILVGTGMSGGIRLLDIHHKSDNWSVDEVWTSKSIKPYFNDFVISDEYLYGFDNNVFLCVSLNDKKVRWRARGYGNGQVLFIVEDQLLLILTETGEVALVQAKPDEHTEIAKFKAIEGKTWNHPVIAHQKLFVRNAEEVACLALPYVEASSTTSEEQPSPSKANNE